MARGLVGVAALLAAPLRAEVAQVDTPQGVARVEGSPARGGQRVPVGDRVALAAEEVPCPWSEAERGSRLPVGPGSGGTACAALWTWLDAGDPGLRRTDASGTCSDLAAVTSDAETVTVTTPPFDGDGPSSAVVRGGQGEVVEAPRGQQFAGMAPGDPAASVGRCALDLFRASDWRGPLEAMMGPEACREAQAAGDLCAPMERRGDRVVGTAVGHRANSGCVVAAALGGWGAVAVGPRPPDGTQDRRGGTSPGMLAALAEAGGGAP